MPIRTALIGYGFAGKTFHAPLLRAVEALELAVVVSSDADKVRADLGEVEVLTTLEEALARTDIELVVIASPNQTHAPHAEAALLAGKHVVVDKPFTLTLAEARHLTDLSHRQQRLLSVFHNRRFDTDYLAIRELLASQRLGRLVRLSSRIDRYRPQVRDRWREQALPGSGLWFDLGPHLVDQALCLFGPPEALSADIRIQRQGGQADDGFEVHLEYPGLRVTIGASMLVAGFSPRFVAHGDRGSALKQGADQQEAQLLRGIGPGHAEWGRDPDPLRVIDGEGAEQLLAPPEGDQSRYYQGIAAAIAGKAGSPTTPEQACSTMAIIELAQAASAQGRRLPVELTAAERQAWINT